MDSLTLTGVLKQGFNCRNGDADDEGAYLIGTTDLIEEIYDRFAGPVNVRVNGHLIASGVSTADLGWSYSEDTPMDSDAWRVGDVDLIKALEPYVYQEITLVVEPAEGPQQAAEEAS